MNQLNVEATLKMNDMVKNLTKHGIISNSHEALEMASKMYNVEKNDEDMGINIEMSNEQKIKEELKSMIDKRLQYFLEKHNSMVYKEFQEIWTKMNQLGPHFENKIEQMRNEMSVINQNQPNDVQQSTQKKLRQEINQDLKENKEEKIKDNPRSGKFDNDDVSVEKFFYFGEK